jgi:chitin synthase
MVYLRSKFRKGFMGFTKGTVSKRAKTSSTRNTVIYRGNVYDMTGYINNDGGGILTPEGTQAPPNTDRQFMHDQVVSLFKTYAGADITKQLDSLNVDKNVMAAQRVCRYEEFGSVSILSVYPARIFDYHGYHYRVQVYSCFTVRTSSTA